MMATSNVGDKGDSDEESSTIERLRAQVAHDLSTSFTKVEDQINDCVKRWKGKLQLEKQRLLQVLQLDGIYERLYPGDNHFSSHNIQSDTEYCQKVLRKLQCNIITNTDFGRILQYDGSILQCDHLSDSEDGVAEINKGLGKESDADIETDLSSPDIGLETRSSSTDNDVLNTAQQIAVEEIGEAKESNPVVSCASERHQQSVYISSDEVSGSFKQIPSFGSIQQNKDNAHAISQENDPTTSKMQREKNFRTTKHVPNYYQSNDSGVKGGIVGKRPDIFPSPNRKLTIGSIVRNRGSLEHVEEDITDNEDTHTVTGQPASDKRRLLKVVRDTDQRILPFGPVQQSKNNAYLIAHENDKTTSNILVRRNEKFRTSKQLSNFNESNDSGANGGEWRVSGYFPSSNRKMKTRLVTSYQGSLEHGEEGVSDNEDQSTVTDELVSDKRRYLKVVRDIDERISPSGSVLQSKYNDYAIAQDNDASTSNIGRNENLRTPKQVSNFYQSNDSQAKGRVWNTQRNVSLSNRKMKICSATRNQGSLERVEEDISDNEVTCTVTGEPASDKRRYMKVVCDTDAFVSTQEGAERNVGSRRVLPEYIGSRRTPEYIGSGQTHIRRRSQRDVLKHVNIPGQVMFMHREEIVRPFGELINQIPDLPKIPQQRSDTAMMSPGNPVVQISKHKHNATDRNWVDILLFSNYYLVIIQKKQANVGTNEWLNKYDKGTGEKSSWLSLPEAGKMCKVSKKGVVAVLQIGRQNRCIAIVKTSDTLSRGNINELELMYRIDVDESYNAITCLSMSCQKVWSEPNLEMRFAGVVSVNRDGKPLEEVDIFYPQTLSKRLHKGIKTYTCIKSTVFSKGGLNNISALTADKMIVTTINKVTCITTQGKFVWDLPMPTRVTDICCFGSRVFVCLQDIGQLLQIEIQNDQGVTTDNNVLRDEPINPSQVSMCGHEVLIREFILEEYRSEVIIRIIRV